MTTRAPAAALWLGLTGLIPFYASVALTAAADPELVQLGRISFSIYAAVILSFLGGARWGLEIARAPSAPDVRRLVFSVLGSIAGWLIAGAAVLGAMAFEAAAFAAVFAAHLIWDRSASPEGLAPAWYAPLRQTLTIGVLLACALAPFASLMDVR